MSRARNAAVWNHFVMDNASEKKAVCNYCTKTLSYKSTITNLKLHLKQKHKSVYEEFCKSETARPSGNVEERESKPLSSAIYLIESNTERSENSNSPQGWNSPSESDSVPAAKRQRRVQEMFIAKDQIDEAFSIVKSNTENEKQVEECDLYGKLLAEKLKALEVDDRLVLMNEIDNLVFKYVVNVRRRN